MVFLMPFVVKLEHRHEHSFSKQEGENSASEFGDKCLICNFEFSSFVTAGHTPEMPQADSPDRYRCNFNSGVNSDFIQFSFHLRAPPVKQV